MFQVFKPLQKFIKAKLYIFLQDQQWSFYKVLIGLIKTDPQIYIFLATVSFLPPL